MKIAVVGPGAMGCFFAVRLAEAGHDLCLLDHDQARASEISREGITIEASGSSQNIKIRTVCDVIGVEPVGLVIVCVKAFDTEEAMSLARPLISEHTVVLSLQNGWGNAQRILSVTPSARVVCGATAQGAVLLGDGCVRHSGDGDTRIAAWDATSTAAAERSVRVLTDAGIHATLASDCRRMIWEKIIVNAAINPLTALSGVRNGVLLRDSALRETMGFVVAESTAVARDAGMDFRDEDMLRQVEAVCEATEDNESSMLQDFRAGKRTEIDFITGVIIERAGGAGIPVPANEVLFSCVKGAEKAKGN